MVNTPAPLTTILRPAIRKKYQSLQLLDFLPETVSDEAQAMVTVFFQSQKHTVISCAGLTALPASWCELFRFIGQELKTVRKKLCLIHVSEQLRELIAPFGFKTHPDLCTALQDFTIESGQLDQMHYIKAFVAATTRAFFVQAKTRCERGKVYVRPTSNEFLIGDVSGVINVESVDFSYLVILSFPKATYLKMIAILLEEEHTEITKEIADGAAEMLNLIYGQAKIVLNQKKAGIKPQLPVFVLGKTLPESLTKVQQILETGKTVVVPFNSEIGDFFIQICFPVEFKERLLTKG